MGHINSRQFERDHDGKRNVCSADGRPATAEDPLVNANDGYRVHTSHTTTPGDGYHGQRQT